MRRLELVVLRPDATRSELSVLCSSARRHGCHAVCVTGARVELAASLLEDSPVKVSALVGFPFGASGPDVKRFEVEAAVDAGAQEVDVVLNHGWLKDGQTAAVLRELRDVREAAEERPVKVIVESGLLTPEDLRTVTTLVGEAEVQFLVTATGCAVRAATPEEVQAVREAAGPELGIKAVGGIGDPALAAALVAAGANRLGVFSLDPFAAPD